MKKGAKLTIEMKAEKDGVRANVTLNEKKKTYFFPFDIRGKEAFRVDHLIGRLPKNFYVDLFLEHTKWE